MDDDDNKYGHPNNGSPLAKRARHIKRAVADANDIGDETNSGTAANNSVVLAKRAWDHYRNYIDGNDDDDDDGEEEEEEENDEDAITDSQATCHNGQANEYGGDIDELMELIDILLSSSAAATAASPSPSSAPMKISPLLPSDTTSSSLPSTNNTNANPLLLLLLSTKSDYGSGIANCLLPILLSMTYVHLANHAVSESFMTTSSSLSATEASTCNHQNDNSSSSVASSSPTYYFQQALHYWPTNPIALSLLANLNRMYNRSTTIDVCNMYVKAAENAAFWRKVALEYLERGEEEGANGDDCRGEEDDEEEEMEDEDINAKEWVELLVLNGALDVDYIGKDDDDDEDDSKITENSVKGEGGEGVQEEYSPSGVEATASFMSAFLLSTLSKHDEALFHLQKFRLSHRIHPNVWLAAAEAEVSLNKQVKELSSCPSAPSSSSSLVSFPPRIYGRGASERNSNNNDHGLLPPELYHRLCDLFAPNAPYWKESNYDHRGYYSYFINLSDDKNSGADSVKAHPTNIIEDVIVNHLLPLAEQVLQEKESSSSSTKTSSPPPPRIVGAEWWTHTRPLGANLGHQLHFDTDESLLEREKRVTHPIISSVLYLTGAGREGCQDGSGGGGAGSTIVFDQTPESTDVAPKAWISHPRDNSFMAFPGNLLHGVLPCSGTGCIKCLADTGAGAGDHDATIRHRLTFMVGFWTRNVTEGMDKDRELYTPCGQLPPPSEHSWVLQSQQGYGSTDVKTRPARQTNDDNYKEYDDLPSVSPAWERIICSEGGNNDSALIIPMGLDHRFFVRNAPHCFSESLYEK